MVSSSISKILFYLISITTPPNNLEKLHKIDMRGQSNESFQTKHAKWINMWNNCRELTLSGRSMHGPLFHSREYMEWYMANSIYLLLVSQILKDSCRQPKPPSEPTFPAATNYNHPQHDHYRHSFVTTIEYYQPQQEPYRHSFTIEEFNTSQPQPVMDDRKQSCAFTSTDFLSNLFGVNLNTSASANNYMQ